MSVFVGLDCGGSSTRVMAVDSKQAILFQGRSGAANLISTPPERFERNLMSAAQGCPAPSYVCGCFAGLIDEEARNRALVTLKKVFPTASISAEPDYAAALYACPEGTDICVIAGTGSLVCSSGPNGIVKSGGRGYLIGDFGSAFNFGRDALVGFLDAGGNASPILTSAVEEIFGTTDESTIVRSIYRQASPAATLAKLAKPLGQDAARGEPYALESVNRNVTQLLNVVMKHVDQHFPGEKPLRVCLAGGVWSGPSIFRTTFEDLFVKRCAPRLIEVTRIQSPPVYGAVILAREFSSVN